MTNSRENMIDGRNVRSQTSSVASNRATMAAIPSGESWERLMVMTVVGWMLAGVGWVRSGY